MAGPEAGAQAARACALAVLRIRGAALGAALLPAAVAVVLLIGGATGRIGSFEDGSWGAARWAVTGVALVVLAVAALVAVVVARARPALSPTVPIAEESAPDLYRLVRDLAERLEVPAPSAIALTPDCDSWLEDRTHRAHASPERGRRPGRKRSGGRAGSAGGSSGGPEAVGGGRGAERAAQAPVLVIGSPFLWWMRVAELRALLAPVVAGTGPSAQPDIAAARRFVRGLDAAVAVSARARGPLRGPVLGLVGRLSRLMLRACRDHAAEMERGVAAAASERAQTVDYGLRIVAQEQVGLAYAGWDRLLTRVALPAWRMGRWPSRLDAGVVSALTELSRRDRLAEGFASRLGERPACDLLEEPGAVDRAASLLAARLFHGGPAEPGPTWSPIGWSQYPEEVVDRKWRLEAARLHRVLDDLPPPAASAATASGPAPSIPTGTPEGRPGAECSGPTLARVIEHLVRDEGAGDLVAARLGAELEREEREERARAARAASRTRGKNSKGNKSNKNGKNSKAAKDTEHTTHPESPEGRTGGSDGPDGANSAPTPTSTPAPAPGAHPADGPDPADAPAGPDTTGIPLSWGDGLGETGVPLFPLQPPRTTRELLADHVTAMVCCAAVDTAGAAPGLDWLDGPALLVGGERRSDFGRPVLSLVDDGDAEPLRGWLNTIGVRPEKPVRLV